MSVASLLCGRPGGGPIPNRIFAYDQFTPVLVSSWGGGTHTKGITSDSDQLFPEAGRGGYLYTHEAYVAAKLFKCDGFTTVLVDSWTVPFLEGVRDAYGLAFDDSGNLIRAQEGITGNGVTRAYQQDGDSAVVTDSWLITSGGGTHRLPGITWKGDSEDVLTSITAAASTGMDRHARHDGFSAVILDSYTPPAPLQTLGHSAIYWDDDGSHVLFNREVSGATWGACRTVGFSAVVEDAFSYPESMARRGMHWLPGGLVEFIDLQADGSGQSAEVDVTAEAFVGLGLGLEGTAQWLVTAESVLEWLRIIGATPESDGRIRARPWSERRVAAEASADGRIAAALSCNGRVSAEVSGCGRISARIVVNGREYGMGNCPIALNWNANNDLKLSDVIDTRDGSPIPDAATVEVEIYNADADPVEELTAVSPVPLSQLAPPDDNDYRGDVLVNEANGFAIGMRLQLDYSYDAGSGKVAFFRALGVVRVAES